jgi:DNA-binding MarR family transcriptional regulator
MNSLSARLVPTPPTPDENPIRSLIRTLGLIERLMQPYFARFGISGSQWGVLRALHRAKLDGKTSMRLTDLGERLLIRPPSVTGVVERLARGGLVARKNSPDDLRAKLVSLTPKGERIVRQVLASHPAQTSALLGGLSAQEQVELQRLLVRLDQHLETLLDGGIGNPP